MSEPSVRVVEDTSPTRHQEAHGGLVETPGITCVRKWVVSVYPHEIDSGVIPQPAEVRERIPIGGVPKKPLGKLFVYSLDGARPLCSMLRVLNERAQLGADCHDQA